MNRLLTAHLSDIGRIRRSNQDHWALESLGDRTLLVVADGMGGHAGGQEASQIATATIVAYVSQANPEGDPGDLLVAALQNANQAIRSRADEDVTLRGMGTTAVCVLVNGSKAHWAHVGDSRIYMHRDQQLQQITRDQSRVQELVDGGHITAEEARVHPLRNVITQALGSRPEVTPQNGLHALRDSDTLILCTDGLNGMVTDERIENILNENGEPNAQARALVDAALEAGGEDNVTVVLATQTT